MFSEKELSFFLQTIQIFFSIPCNRWLLAWWEVEVVHCPSPGPPASSGRWTYVAPSSPPLWGCYSSAPHCHGEVTAAGVDVLCISLQRCSGRAPCLRAGRRNTGGPICWGKNTILIIMLSFSMGFTQFLHYVTSSMQRIMDLHTKHIKLIVNYGRTNG